MRFAILLVALVGVAVFTDAAILRRRRRQAGRLGQEINDLGESISGRRQVNVLG